MNRFETRRRDLVAAPMLAMAAMALRPKPAQAAGVDPAMTIITLPDAIPWKPLYNFPPGMAESADMFSNIHAPAPIFRAHSVASWLYERAAFIDRPAVRGHVWHVVCSERRGFAPDATVPVPAGSFVRRVAKIPHYDGVKKGAKEPAIIAISGIGPITYHLTDPTKPGWREV